MNGMTGGLRDTGSRRSGTLGSLRRIARLALTGVVASVGLVVALPAAQACGCGGFAGPEGAEINVTREEALIQLVEGNQNILLSMAAVSETPSAALLIPTPTPATVALGDEAVMDELYDLSLPEITTEYNWWPDLAFGTGASAGAPDGGVSVYDEVRLGPLDVITLGASDAGTLATWLGERGYQLSPTLEASLAPYGAEGWSYVAVRLAPEAGNLDGAIPPLQITFPSSSLIYPMRLSSAASDAQNVRTYVLDTQRVDRTDALRGNATTVFAGGVNAEDSPELATWLAPYGGTAYLTTTDQTFNDPKRITSDFTFLPSGGPDVSKSVTVTVDRIILGLNAGPVLVGIGFLVVAIGGIVISRVMRRRWS